MFRQSLRRCVQHASLTSRSTLIRSHPVLQSWKANSSGPSRALAQLNVGGSLPRFYSSQAEAPEVEVPNENSEMLTSFTQLSALNVHRNLVSNITDKMGYETMTPVQSLTITPALKGTDIVAQAKTGTGKTIAFLLPLLQRMINDDPTLATRSAARTARSDDIRGIVLSPTRELAEQIAVEAKRLVQGTGLVVQSAVGGTRKDEMLRRTQREGCHLLVATPGRLNDLLQDMNTGIDAPKLSALVLDEADRMLDVGFEKELNEILDCLPDKKTHVRQTMLVSATIPDDVIRLARSMVRPDDFEFVQTIPENESLTHDKVPQFAISLPSWSQVFPTLYELIEREQRALQNSGGTPFKAIVYFNTTAMVQLAGEAGYIRRTNRISNLPSYSIHSKLTQQRRTAAAEAFRRQRTGILYSSDVTARGMDFPDVTHVIQIGAPSDRESYIHRLGRTGRQGKEGRGFIVLPDSDVRAARGLLKGLPIEPEKDLNEPKAEIMEEELTQYQKETRDTIGSVPPNMLREAYTSLFGKASDKISLAEDLNVWATEGLGLSKPPAVGHGWVSKMGLSRVRGMNIEERSARFEREDGGARFGSDRRGGNGGGSRGGNRFQRKDRDAFDTMKRNVRREDRGGNRAAW